MAGKQLGKLFAQDDLRLVVDLADDLQQEVGDDAFSLPVLERTSNTATVELFDQPLKADGSFAAHLALLGTGATLDPFGGGRGSELRPGFNVASLEVDTAFGIRGEVSLPTSGFTVSGKAAAARELHYLHALPCRGQTRLNALARAVSRSRLPQLVGLAIGDPGFPDIGEVHRLEAMISLDLGLELEAGRAVQEELVLDLFGGLSTSLQVTGEATVKAALGLSLLDRMHLTVGRACQLNDGWIRVRLERERERRLTFGAEVALRLHYDLGSGLVALLEETLDPLRTSRTLDDLRAILEPLEAGDWSAIRDRLSGEAFDWLSGLLDDTGWRDWLADSPQVARLTEISRRIVDLYDGVDPLVQSWLDRLLASAQLGPGSPVRALLDRVAALDVERPVSELLDLFLDGDARDLVELVETFTGSTLDDLLLASDPTVRHTLDEAVGLAGQARAFLDKLETGLPAEVHDFFDRTRITRTVDFLRRTTLSKSAIEARVDGAARRVVERLLGKAWDAVTEADLDRVQSWAARVQDLLAKPEEIEAKLRAQLEKLELDYGLSLSLEIERVSRSTALLDLELDPAKAHARLQRKLAKALRVGDARRMLQVLAEDTADRKEDDPLPFQLRECVFTSERLRTSGFTAFLSILGLGRKFVASLSGVGRRIEQTTLRVRQAEGGGFERRADYAAGFERTESENKSISSAAVWIECREHGSGLDLDAVYDGERTSKLCLTYSREDDSASEGERASLDHLLRDLGFIEPIAPAAVEAAPEEAAGGRTTAPASELVPPGSRTRFSLKIQLPGEALTAIAANLSSQGGQQDWDMMFLDAAHRWLTDPSVHRLPIKPTQSSVGPVLAEFLERPLFLANWQGGSQALRMAIQGAPASQRMVTVDGVQVTVDAVRQTLATPVWKPPYGLLEGIVSKRGSGLAALRDVGRKWADAGGREPAVYDALLPSFAAGWRRAWVYTVNWPNPLFGLWLAVARLTRIDPDLLAAARGAAYLHVKTSDEESWTGPWIWRLEGGIPNNIARGTFPFN